MKSSKKTATIICLFFLAAIATTYVAVLPAVVSSQYTGRVGAVVGALESDFLAIRKSTELPLIANPSAPEAVKRSNARYISRLVSRGQQRIGLLKAANKSFEPPPYSGVLWQYRDAEVLHGHTERLIAQSEAALKEYLALVSYLEAFNEAADSVVSELDEFNAVVDINTYGGQSEELQQIAKEMRADAALLSELSYPNGAEALNAAAVVAFNEAADGFEDLAAGLTISADDPIYTAAHRIEDATLAIDTISSTMYGSSLGQSRVIKDVQDLNEKLELALVDLEH